MRSDLISERKLKVVFISIGVLDGNGFQRSYQLAKGLVRLGHEVTLLVSSKNWRGGREIRHGVELVTFFDPTPYQLKKGGASLIELVQRIVWLSNKQFDLVFVDCGFRPTTGIPGFYYSKLKGVPYICEWWDWIGRGGIFEKKSRFCQWTLCLLDDFFESYEKKHADGVVALSTCLKNRALALGLTEEQLCVIYGGADIDQKQEIDKLTARKLLGIAPDAFVVGFAGMDGQEVDDLKPFMQAVPELIEKINGFMWFSTGGKLRDDLRSLYGVGSEYKELGWVDYQTYQNYLAAADVLLLIQEDTLINRARWPNKLGDYLAAHSVVVATEVGEVGVFAGKFERIGIEFVKWDKESVISGISKIYANPVNSIESGRMNAEIAQTACSWDTKAAELSAFMAQSLKSR